jgi:hypothetical protein
LEDWKVKISVLWLIIDVAYLADLVLGFMEPGFLQQFLTSGEILGTKIGLEFLFVTAVALLVPLVMAFLSLTLKNSINRWINIIVGVVYVALWIIALIGPLAQHPVAYSILITLSKLVASAVIVWYAYNHKTVSMSLSN